MSEAAKRLRQTLDPRRQDASAVVSRADLCAVLGEAGEAANSAYTYAQIKHPDGPHWCSIQVTPTDVVLTVDYYSGLSESVVVPRAVWSLFARVVDYATTTGV